MRKSEEKPDQHLARFDLFEFDTENGTDHRVEAMFRYGGLEIKFDTTFDRVRTFFTEQRRKRAAQQEKAQLALVGKVKKEK